MKNKAFYVLLVVVALPLIAYFFIWENANIQKDQEIQKNLAITRAAAIGINGEVKEMMERNARTASHNSYQNLSHYLRYDRGIMYVLTPQGKVIANTSAQTLKSPICLPIDRFVNLALEGKTVVTDLEKSPFGNYYTLAVYTPIKRGHEIVGILARELSPNHFKDILASLKIGKTGKLVLLDSEGYFIYTERFDTSTKKEFSTAFRDNADKSISVVERISAVTGKETIFTKVRLPDTGWYVVGFQRSNEIAASSQFILARTIIFIIFLSVLLLIFHYCKYFTERHNRLLEQQRTEKLALIGGLATGMAHEIRNPLTTIKGFTELLADPYFNGNSQEPLELIRESVQQIDDIVTQTLLLAKPQKMHVTDINIRDLIHEVYASKSPEALMREIDFRCRTVVGTVIVRGDCTHLKHLLFNLLENSFDATPPKGKVFLESEAGPGMLRIMIKDTGSGMDKGVLSKIGTPFFTTKPEGTGLGIPVCQRIAHEHGGLLYIDSKPELGTTITVELPCEITTQRDLNPESAMDSLQNHPLYKQDSLRFDQLCLADVELAASQETSKS